jgi:hypothetical protein
VGWQRAAGVEAGEDLAVVEDRIAERISQRNGPRI